MADHFPAPGGDDIAGYFESTDQPLFVPDTMLRGAVARHIGKAAFAAAIKTLEAEGFPPIIALFRGRYLPAVKAWLEDKYGMRANAEIIGGAEDGQENFDAHPRQRSGTKERARPSPLLDRPPSGARHDGISRLVCPLRSGPP